MNYYKYGHKAISLKNVKTVEMADHTLSKKDVNFVIVFTYNDDTSEYFNHLQEQEAHDLFEKIVDVLNANKTESEN